MEFYELVNPIKHYDWGSTRWLPELLGEENPQGLPWAELWMGTHPQGASEAVAGPGETVPLGNLIGQAGGRGPEAVPGRLPFLFKVLAARKPLSLQAHPDREQARRGFEGENSRGIPRDAPERNYRDPNPKPEILCALSPFKALAGFRKPEEAAGLLNLLPEGEAAALGEGREVLLHALKGEKPWEEFFRRLFSLDRGTFLEMGEVLRGSPTPHSPLPVTEAFALAASLSEEYPGDPGILAPLFLNIVELRPGEAFYISPGVLHGYIEGLGVELMAPSDNVLRGGLTSKHVDREELQRVLRFAPYKPRILPAPPPGEAFYQYKTPAEEFRLSVLKGAGGGGAAPWPIDVPAIALATHGEAVFSDASGECHVLDRGKSAYIPPPAEKTEVRGAYCLYVASGGK